MSKFSKKEIERADMARTIAKRLGYCSDASLSRAIRNSSISNLPITLNDLHNANQIYGPEIAALKGKSTARKAHIALPNSVNKMSEKLQELTVDIIFVNNESYLLSISSPLKLIMIDDTITKESSHVARVLSEHIDVYKSEGFVVTKIHCDNDTSFIAAKQHINKHGVQLSTVGIKSNGIAIVDKAVRTVKERVRSILHGLPYELPASLMTYAIKYAVHAINLIETSQSVVSPRELFTGRRTDFNTDLRISFGEYIQTYSPETNNSMDERTSGCIALLPTGNCNGSVYCFHMSTKRVIVRDKWVSLPMPTTVLDYLNDLAMNQASKSRLPTRDPVFTYRGQIVTSTSSELLEEDFKLVPTSHEYAAVRNAMYENQYAVENEPMNYVPPPIGSGRIVTLDSDDNDDDDDDDDELITSSSSPVPPDTANDFDSTLESTQSFVDVSSPEPTGGETVTGGHALTLPTRTRQKCHPNPKYFHIDNISIDDALLESPDLAATAISEELQQMIDLEVFEPMPPSVVKDLGKVITCKMFLKKKFNTDGDLTRWKGRLVAGGHQQIRSSTSSTENSSPTAHINTVFLVALMAARQNRHTATCDIKGAYLHARMQKNVYMRLGKRLSQMISKLEDKYKNYSDKSGNIVVKLNKALYGCVESAKLWYLDISNHLVSLGFTVSQYDKCLFTKLIDGEHIHIVIFVDDFLMTAVSKDHLFSIESSLKEKYKELSITYSDVLDYLGMKLDFSIRGQVTMSMKNYIEKLVDELNSTELCDHPCSKHLFSSSSEVILPVNVQQELHSVIAKLLYLSTRCRPDIALPVNYLCGRVNKCDLTDLQKLNKIIHYLHKTINLGITLRCDDPDINIDAYIDASYGINKDRRSQSGMAIFIGHGSLLTKSVKQRINTKSSTEAELVACSDAIAHIHQVKNILCDLGETVKCINIHQDNKSTITLISCSEPVPQQSRHIDIRYFFMRDQLNYGIIVTYCPTKDMIADMLTKPLTGKQFKSLRDILLGIKRRSNIKLSSD